MSNSSSFNPAATPDISVVIPAYNSANFIEDAIRSLLVQTYENFEIVVVDDGSTDKTFAIVQRMAQVDGRIRIIRQKNGGISSARNAGVENSRAPLIAVLDSDDIALPERLEQQRNYMLSHPRCVAVGSDLEIVDPKGRTLWIEIKASEHAEVDARLLQGDGSALSQPAVMMRKDAVVACGGYRVEYSDSEDLDLFLRLAEIGELANISKPLTKYRQHPDSTNATRWQHQGAQMRRIVSDAFRRRGLGSPSDLRFHTFPPYWERLKHWGWTVLKNGHRARALEYAARSFCIRPSLESFRLAVCAIRIYKSV